MKGGGNENPATSGWFGDEFQKKGWKETEFDVRIKVDEAENQSSTHSIDCYKNRVGLAIEWNNKDPFFNSSKNCNAFFHEEGGTE